VVSLTTFSAKDAPTPLALPSEDCLASASAWLSKLEDEVSVRSPLTAIGSVPSSCAIASATRMLIAIDPATPTLLPPAPEVDCAFVVDGPEPCVASRVTPLPVRVTFFETRALVVMSATLTATAIPTPEVGLVVGGASVPSERLPLSAKTVTAPSVVSSFSSPVAVLR
jgi:hypothetical protein